MNDNQREKGKGGGVLYAVTYGVTSRHLTESLGSFQLWREAKAAYEGLKLENGWQAKRLVRMSFKDRWSGCSECKTLEEVIY